MSSTALQDGPGQPAERGRPADGLLEFADIPLVHCGHRDDLLRKHVERIARHPQFLDLPGPHALVTTVDWTRSPWYFGKKMPRDSSPTLCPARPVRCSPLATEGGDSTWMTRSTAPMSMPSSRLEVATTAGSVPALSASSI